MVDMQSFHNEGNSKRHKINNGKWNDSMRNENTTIKHTLLIVGLLFVKIL